MIRRLLVLAVLLAGCGGAAAAPVTDTIAMEDFAFTPAEGSVGTDATVTAVNAGDLAHDLNLREEGGERLAGTAVVAAGDETELTVDVPPGQYVMYCSVPGHEDSGMSGQLTVTG